MTGDPVDVDPADAELLLELAAVVRAADPAPALAHELGRAALSTRRIDAELAELVSDELHPVGGVRGAGPLQRELAFAWSAPPGVTAPPVLRLTVTPTAAPGLDQVAVEGWLEPVPAGGGRVRFEPLCGPDLSTPLHDLTGSFALDAVPRGRARLHVEVAGRPAVTTTWVAV